MGVEHCDVLVVGSGAAALTAALRAARGGLSVTIAEKSELLGGTSAMSGAGIWIPANHLAREAGIKDSAREALQYVRAASPADWQEQEDALWQALVDNAPRMLTFLGSATPLRFELVDQSDPMCEYPGGKAYGRMLSPRALSRNLLGRLARDLRRSPLPHLFTYREIFEYRLQDHTVRAILRLWPKLLWRVVRNAGGQGTALVTGLLKGCLDAGCRLRPGMRASRLLHGADGMVKGAEFDSAEFGRRTVLARHGVVIASGGFEWDGDLLSTHFPEPGYRIGSCPANTGDGHRMAAAVGAKLDRMDQANVYVCYPSRPGRDQTGLPAFFHAGRHSILVNRHARRFASEGDFNLGEAVDRRDAMGHHSQHLPVWLIADARFPGLALRRVRRDADRAPDRFAIAETLQELAGKLGLPADELTESVERFNGFCFRGRDDDFHRDEPLWEKRKSGGSLGPIEQPPFIGVRMDRFMVGTKGGIRTDAGGRALRRDGTTIPGLYAAGLAMANPIGSRGIGAGTTLGPNMTWGYICAETILAGLKS